MSSLAGAATARPPQWRSRPVVERTEAGPRPEAWPPSSKIPSSDATGTPFGFGKSGQPAAPAVIHSRGEQPYSVNKILRALLERDWRYAALEKSISDKLTGFGYAPSFGGVMVPLGGDALMKMPGYEQEMERFAVEVKHAFELDVDPDHLAVLQHQYVGKAMDPLDSTAGGSLLPSAAQGELIQLLRALAVVARAGATQVPLPLAEPCTSRRKPATRLSPG